MIRAALVTRVESFGLASGVIRYVGNPTTDSLIPPALAARVRAAQDSIIAAHPQ